jgi:pantetheine-phosphate adenylyltransferase
MSLALCPGSFDPFTNGHLDIVARAARLFERVEVVVAVNASKQTLLTIEERCDLIRACTAHLENVAVAPFEGLLIDHARAVGAVTLVRGLRQVSDFDYEVRMAFVNRRLHPELDTLFLMPSQDHALIHSSLVREVYRWGGDVSSFVPPPVLEALSEKRAGSGRE